MGLTARGINYRTRAKTSVGWPITLLASMSEDAEGLGLSVRFKKHGGRGVRGRNAAPDCCKAGLPAGDPTGSEVPQGGGPANPRDVLSQLLYL